MTSSKPLQYITVLPQQQRTPTQKQIAIGMAYGMGPEKLIEMALKLQRKKGLKFAIRSETPIIKGKKK